MDDQAVLKLSQKNEIFKLINDNNLRPKDFKWTIVPSNHKEHLEVSRMHYDYSPFFYQFDFDEGGHCGVYSPGKNKLIELVHPGSWGTQKFYVSEWLKQLRIEIEQPDLWSEIAKHQLPADPTLTTNISNDLFDEKQIEKILPALNQIRAFIQQEGLASGQQYELVDERLKYLADAAKRLGRKDWLHTCIGVMATIIVGLALTPQHSQALWNLVKSILISILQLLPG